MSQRHTCIATLLGCLGAVSGASEMRQHPNFQAGVDLVQVECSVTKDGKPVPDMRLEDFILLDNGKPRVIEHLWRDTDLPLTIGLVADVSGSQSEFISQHRESLGQFLRQVLREHDQAFLVTIAGDVRLAADFTSSVEELQRGVDAIGARPRPGTLLGDCPPTRHTLLGQSYSIVCTTALWNGVYFTALQKMKPVTGRKALIVLTDGFDHTSPHSLKEAIQAAQSADARVYTIQYLMFRDYLPFGHAHLATERLHRLAEETGGRFYSAPKDGPAAIFK